MKTLARWLSNSPLKAFWPFEIRRSHADLRTERDGLVSLIALEKSKPTPDESELRKLRERKTAIKSALVSGQPSIS